MALMGVRLCSIKDGAEDANADAKCQMLSDEKQARHRFRILERRIRTRISQGDEDRLGIDGESVINIHRMDPGEIRP